MDINEKQLMGAAPANGVSFKAKVLRVIDGDTIEVEVTRKITVRLKDCWAPEVRTKNLEEKVRGIKSSNFLKNYIDDSVIDVFVPASPNQNLSDIFTFGRVVGDAWKEGEEDSLATIMINAGHATRLRQK